MSVLFSQGPFTDNGHQRSVKMLSMNTWDVAVSLTNCDWSFFSNVHEVTSSHFTQCSTREGVLEKWQLKWSLNLTQFQTQLLYIISVWNERKEYSTQKRKWRDRLLTVMSFEFLSLHWKSIHPKFWGLFTVLKQVRLSLFIIFDPFMNVHWAIFIRENN